MMVIWDLKSWCSDKEFQEKMANLVIWDLKMAFRERIYRKSGEFGDLRFKKLVFGQVGFKKLAFRQTILGKSGKFGDFRFKNLAFRQRILKKSGKFGDFIGQ